jgi:hypothetical protein
LERSSCVNWVKFPSSGGSEVLRKLLAKLSCCSTGNLYTSWGDHKLKLLLERSRTVKVGVFKSGIWPCKLLDDRLRNVRFAKLPKVGGMVPVR